MSAEGSTGRSSDGLAGLDAQRRGWAQEAWQHVTDERLRELIVGLVGIPSPTGDERPLAEHITTTLASVGLRAACQPVDGRQANAWA
ncbi:deacylase, partial [Streptomyces sp. NPDC048425]